MHKIRVVLETTLGFTGYEVETYCELVESGILMAAFPNREAANEYAQLKAGQLGLPCELFNSKQDKK